MRHKDTDWNLPAGTPGHGWESIHAALLMDIRDELKIVSRKLSALECPNFTRIPTVLRRISANTHKTRRRRKTT